MSAQEFFQLFACIFNTARPFLLLHFQWFFSHIAQTLVTVLGFVYVDGRALCALWLVPCCTYHLSFCMDTLLARILKPNVGYVMPIDTASVSLYSYWSLAIFIYAKSKYKVVACCRTGVFSRRRVLLYNSRLIYLQTTRISSCSLKDLLAKWTDLTMCVILLEKSSEKIKENKIFKIALRLKRQQICRQPSTERIRTKETEFFF